MPGCSVSWKLTCCEEKHAFIALPHSSDEQRCRRKLPRSLVASVAALGLNTLIIHLAPSVWEISPRMKFDLKEHISELG